MRRNGRQAAVLSRQHGDELRVDEERRSRGSRLLWLVQPGARTEPIPVNMFSRDEVQQAFLARRWRFDPGSW